MKGSNIKNTVYNGRQSLLPPKSPFPSISPSYVDCVTSPAVGLKGVGKPKDANSHHQRTYSESLLMEEQPSWLDELLNEPEMPVCRGGHRRSSSDSFASVDVASASAINYIPQSDYRSKNMISVPPWGLQDFKPYKDLHHTLLYTEPSSVVKPKKWARDPSLNPIAHSSCLSYGRDNVIIQSPESSCAPEEVDDIPSTADEKQDPVESGPQAKPVSESKASSQTKSSASETDTKLAKQQYAQRSRVRKLQYIAELEKNVQALEAEGSEVSAELEFLNQQNFILRMENKALKQRLENLAQERLIKYMEHQVLEREVGRLRALCQQQQQPQQLSSSQGRVAIRDLDKQQHRHSNSREYRDLGSYLPTFL
ncbi:uncharacterized protein At4g06598-like [Diospyros lotus]|uniref:uncharacterized protein At4g06598-like n=1 Tax=Diospyros lotus TaxID=55363 RepID=UPI002257EE31|nr:uncharacterized protein At4g06598-like [Diospyros lotus]